MKGARGWLNPFWQLLLMRLFRRNSRNPGMRLGMVSRRTTASAHRAK